MSRNLRVVHLAKHARPVRGGIETVVNELLGALGRDPRGTETVVLCFAPTSGTETLRRGVVLRRCRTLTTVASAPLSIAMASAYLSARRRADIVHVHVPNPWAVLLVLVFPPRGAIVVGAHAASTRYGVLQAPHDWLMRTLYRRSAAIMVSARSNVRHLGLDGHPGEIRVVPYGIDENRTAGDAERAADSRTVLFVGRLVYYKGLETLIDAAADIKADVVVLGDGPLHDDLVQRCHAAGVADRVRFVRDADDEELRRHLAACSVFVLPSTTTSESFGLAMLEALGSGVPAVVSALGTGLDEVVSDNDAGVVVPPGDPAALAAAITALLDNREERDRLGRNGRNAFAHRYTAARMTDDVVALYREIGERERVR
jgi:glycosyltransferase involved in cell wall biosynthesis